MSPDPRPRLPTALPPALLAVALIAAACGSSAPTPVPPSPTAAPSEAPSGAPSSPAGSASPDTGQGDLYDEIEAAVRGIRGLDEQSPVQPDVLDEASLSEYVRREFEEENPPEYVAAYERLLKHLALVPAEADIKELYLDLLESQVLGLYDPKDDRMVVVSRSGELGVLEMATYAHEYGHALQDQAFDLEAVQAIELDQGDRAIARTALIEGDATLVMTLWAQQHLTQEQLLELATSSTDEDQNAVLERMPAILRESLLFPYTAGLNYVAGLQTSGGWDAVNDALVDPPDTTEQILHPERRDEQPVEVTFPAALASGMGTGWSEVLQDTFGEFQLGVWLREAGLGAIASGDVADGWGGDRVILLEGPEDAWVAVVDIAWDSAAEAEEFRDAAPQLVALLERAGAEADVLTREPTSTTVIVGSSVDTMAEAANLLGLAG